MNKEVHKEHLDQLESRLNSVSQSVEKWGDEVPCLGFRVVGLSDSNLTLLGVRTEEGNR